MWQRNVNLSKLHTLALNSVASRFFHLRYVDDLVEIKKYFDNENLENASVVILGEGSNVVLPPRVPNVVLNQLRGIELVSRSEEAVELKVASGESWDGFVRWCLSQGFGGLENLISIPGTVGAAPIQNIGAYGVEVANYITKVEFIEWRTGEIKSLSANQCEFSYRESVFKRDLSTAGCITAVFFRLHRDTTRLNLQYTELIRQGLDLGLELRSIHQMAQLVSLIRASKLPDPKEFPNVGSFFKNPHVSRHFRNALLEKYPGLVSFSDTKETYKLSAAWLIQCAGFKGVVKGKVGVSGKHSLVLINRGDADQSDILLLANEIKSEVFQKFAVMLEIEPKVISE